MSDANKQQALIELLQQRKDEGRPVQFWLRDDDAIERTDALERFVSLAETYAIPATLALIPAHVNETLVSLVNRSPLMAVAVHGWSHTNHAPPHEKKQELGLHRGADAVRQELSEGFQRLQSLFGDQFVALLVPPWNRISDELVPKLSELGFRALSTFGTEKPASIQMINTHVDLIDWKGTRGGRAHDELLDDLMKVIEHQDSPVGLLTHHLVHDSLAWDFMEILFEITSKDELCEWVSITDIVQ